MTTKKRPTNPSTLTGSPESKRIAAMVLEVLSGTRTTTDASQVLGITLARYYQLEVRALQGLLTALEPMRRGKHRRPEQEVDRLQRENDRLQRDAGRLQALLRASQRAVGILTPPRPEKSKLGGKRKKRPTARALRAVAALRTGPDETTTLPAGKAEPKPEARGTSAGA